MIHNFYKLYSEAKKQHYTYESFRILNDFLNVRQFNSDMGQFYTDLNFNIVYHLQYNTLNT